MVTAKANTTTEPSRARPASTGSTTRTAAAASAKAPKRLPMVAAPSPRSCPSTGTTKVCTSQQADSIQLTSSNRRSMGNRSKSSTRRSCEPCTTLGSSRAVRTVNQVRTGRIAIARKATRKPAWSMHNPANSGPRKLEIAGPMANQLKTRRRVSTSCAACPTWRCSANTATPVAPPVRSALTHSTP